MKRENIFLKFWKVVYPVGIYFILSNIIAVAFAMVSAVLLQVQSMSGGEEMNAASLQTKLTESLYANSMLLTGISAAIMIPIAWLLFHLDRKKDTVSYEKGNVFWFGIIPLAGIMACMGGNQLLSLSKLDVIFPGFNEVQKALYGGNIYIEILTAVILAPIVEELLFRGLVYRRVQTYAGKLPAMIISSLFFGIYHGNVVQGVYAFSVGLLFVFIYDKYKTLTAPILAHMIANLTSVISSETKVFDFLYLNDISFYLSTVVEVLILVAFVIMMQKQVKREEVVMEVSIEENSLDSNYKEQE